MLLVGGSRGPAADDGTTETAAPVPDSSERRDPRSIDSVRDPLRLGLDVTDDGDRMQLWPEYDSDEDDFERDPTKWS